MRLNLDSGHHSIFSTSVLFYFQGPSFTTGGAGAPRSVHAGTLVATSRTGSTIASATGGPPASTTTPAIASSVWTSANVGNQYTLSGKAVASLGKAGRTPTERRLASQPWRIVANGQRIERSTHRTHLLAIERGFAMTDPSSRRDHWVHAYTARPSTGASRQPKRSNGALQTKSWRPTRSRRAPTPSPGSLQLGLLRHLARSTRSSQAAPPTVSKPRWNSKRARLQIRPGRPMRGKASTPSLTSAGLTLPELDEGTWQASHRPR